MYRSLYTPPLGIKTTPLHAIELAKKHDFVGVDLAMGAIDDHEVDQVKEALNASGLRPGYALVPPGTLSPADEEWEKQTANLPKQLARARELGYSRTGTVLLPFHETLPFEACFELHVKRLTHLGKLYSDHGMRLGIEYVSPVTRRAPYPNPFIHDMDGLIKLLDAVGNPSLGILLDCFHWHCASETPEHIARLPQERIVIVHVNDAIAGRPLNEQVVGDRELPGATGVIDLTGFIAALKKIGYDGPVTCEPICKRLNGLPPDEVVAMVSTAMKKFAD
jgi:sugar phosphate isomerase/epimerase